MIENLLTSNPISLDLQVQKQYELSVVIPTRNEAGNIAPLLSRIEQATKGTLTEVVFVDDSTDNTPETITKLQDQFSLHVKLVHRPLAQRKNGLGGAVWKASKLPRLHGSASWMLTYNTHQKCCPRYSNKLKIPVQML